MAFDVIGIGASPLMLMRAVSLASQGARVLLLDRAQLIGGAWVAPRLLGFANVENGVHLLENRPSLLRTLQQDLGIAMAPSDCFGLVAGRRVGMPVTRVLLQAGAGWNALSRGELDKSVRSFRSSWRALGELNSGFYYPEAGASAITNTLHRRLVERGGQLRLGVEASAIEVRDGMAHVTADGSEFDARTVLLASRAFAPVSIAGEPQRLEPETSHCHTAILHFAGSVSFRGAYVEILADPALKRARDLSRLVQPAPRAGECVICVQHRRGFPGEDRALGEQILSQLRRLDLVSADAALIASTRSDVRLSTLTDRSMRQLSVRSRGVIEGLRTTDFADGFVSEFRRLVPAAAAEVDVLTPDLGREQLP